MTEFKMVVKKKLSGIPENLERQLYEFRNKINKKEYFTKQIKTTKKNQTFWN